VRIAAAVALLVAAGASSACRSRADALRADATGEKAHVLQFWQEYQAATERRIAGDFEAATLRYRQALALEPRHEDSLYYLGQCERQRGRTAEARDAFERLVLLNPLSGRGHLALGALLASPDPAEPVDLARAEAHFRRAHEINGEETGPMVRLAEVLIVDGRMREARTWLEAAVRTNAKSVEAALLAASLAWEAGDRAGAKRLAEAAQAAARTETPVKGVLSEGDRKPARAAARIAAPPLENPMGRLLFGEALASARLETSAGDGRRIDLEALARAVSRTRKECLRRAARMGLLVLPPTNVA
jgi:tetratricopeptide (TPR) repeat protein